MNKQKNCLIIVDVQNDFLPGGALAVPGSNVIIPKINHLINQKSFFSIIVATKDWHPKNHKSFASQNPKNKPGDIIKLNGKDQVVWPDHCVQNTLGSNLSDELQIQNIDKIILKGCDENVDSYSAFFDNDRLHQTELYEYLKAQNVTHTFITGLATDYCVKFTAIDSATLGFNTTLILNASMGININPNDVEHACKEMKSHGVCILDHFNSIV